MRRPAKNSSIGSASVDTEVDTEERSAYVDELLLRRPHVAQQANRIEGGVQRGHSVANPLGGPRIRQQPLTGGCWTMLTRLIPASIPEYQSGAN
jgi:hypothetical protein